MAQVILFTHSQIQIVILLDIQVKKIVKNSEKNATHTKDKI